VHRRGTRAHRSPVAEQPTPVEPAQALLDRGSSRCSTCAASPSVVRYVDQKTSQRRAALVRRDEATGEVRLDAFFLSGDTRRASLVDQPAQGGLVRQRPDQCLACGAGAATGVAASQGAVVCACFHVTRSQIDRSSTSLAAWRTWSATPARSFAHSKTHCGAVPTADRACRSCGARSSRRSPAPANHRLDPVRNPDRGCTTITPWRLANTSRKSGVAKTVPAP